MVRDCFKCAFDGICKLMCVRMTPKGEFMVCKYLKISSREDVKNEDN